MNYVQITPCKYSDSTFTSAIQARPVTISSKYVVAGYVNNSVRRSWLNMGLGNNTDINVFNLLSKSASSVITCDQLQGKRV